MLALRVATITLLNVIPVTLPVVVPLSRKQLHFLWTNIPNSFYSYLIDEAWLARPQEKLREQFLLSQRNAQPVLTLKMHDFGRGPRPSRRTLQLVLLENIVANIFYYTFQGWARRKERCYLRTAHRPSAVEGMRNFLMSTIFYTKVC